MRYFLLAALTFTGCSEEPCILPPCAAPIALEIAIASSTGGPVTATVAVSGAVVRSFSCSSTCPVTGSGGTYSVDVTATGFTPVHESIQVTSTPRPCSCEIVHTQDVQITLVPTA